MCLENHHKTKFLFPHRKLKSIRLFDSGFENWEKIKKKKKGMSGRLFGEYIFDFNFCIM